MMKPGELEALEDLAEHLYSFLPGSPKWRTTYTFLSACQEVHLEQYWQSGPKGAAIERLLFATHEKQRGRFPLLIETVVRNGVEYRDRINDPVSRAELDQLNRIIERLGFEVRALLDPAFRKQRPDLAIDDAAREARGKVVLQQLNDDYLRMQEKGVTDETVELFSRMLNRLFRLAGLERIDRLEPEGSAVRGAFRLERYEIFIRAELGEQVTRDTLEAFRKEQAESAQLLGLFLSVNGFSMDAVELANAEAEPVYLLMDGAHLFRVLHADLSLEDMMHKLVTMLAVEKNAYVPVSALL